MTDLSQYFTDEELACKGSGIVKLDPLFAGKLLFYRETLGFPLIVNSCCRSWEHNQNVGGAMASYHLFEGVEDGREGTLAIDLKVPNDKKRAIMIETALAQNWSVGVYKSFIHIDMRTVLGKPQACFWGRY